MRFRFSRDAAKDLQDIGDYIARDNPVRAISFVDEIEKRCRGLTTLPASGAPRPDSRESMRSIAFGRYVILYVVRRDLLEIKRVLHGARDLRRLL